MTYNIMAKGERSRMMYTTLHRKLEIERHEPHKKQGVNSGAPEQCAVSMPLVTRVVLL